MPDRRGGRHLRIGERIRIRLSDRQIEGEVVEIRGDIGVGGRRLLRVRVNLQPDIETLFEVPEEEIEAVDAV